MLIMVEMISLDLRRVEIASKNWFDLEPRGMGYHDSAAFSSASDEMYPFSGLFCSVAATLTLVLI